MQRLACVATMLLVLPGIHSEAASDADNERAAVRAVLETVFNHKASLRQRVRLVDDGKPLRGKIEQLDDARVGTIRLHGNRAEGHLEFVRASGEPLGQLLPFGVLVRDDGRWMVSRYTICALALMRGASQCPGRSPTDIWRAYHMGMQFDRVSQSIGGQPVVPATFPDGTTATLAFPAGVDIGGSYIRSAGALAFGSSRRDFEATYRARPAPELTKYRGVHGSWVLLDYEGNLTFRAGQWWVRVYAADLDEDERAFLAQHVQFTATRNGLVIFQGDEQVQLFDGNNVPVSSPVFGRSVPTKSAFDPTGFPTVSFAPNGTAGHYGQFVLVHNGCATTDDLPAPAGDASVGQRCLPGTGIELLAEGDVTFVNRLLTETRLVESRSSISPSPERATTEEATGTSGHRRVG